MIRCERATVERAGRIVIEAVSLAVASGQAAAVVGRTGSGKSTLLAAVATAVPLHSGEILVNGRSVRREPEEVRAAVGYVPDRLPAWPGLRAAEFLELVGVANGLRGKQLRQAVTRALEMAGLVTSGQAPLDTLAAGHRKRLLVSRALLHDPQVLILDDPFGGLDPFERGEMERLVGDAHLMDRTVLAAIDNADVPGCFTHLIVLREGRLETAGLADPGAFAAGRTWTYAIVCRGAAEAAARVLEQLGGGARAVDADTVTITVDSERSAPADAVAAVVRAGIAVERAGYQPPWPAQLIR